MGQYGNNFRTVNVTTTSHVLLCFQSRYFAFILLTLAISLGVTEKNFMNGEGNSPEACSTAITKKMKHP